MTDPLEGYPELSKTLAGVKLPVDFNIELSNCGKFYRSTIYDPMGRPVGIGESPDPSQAILKAVESFKKNHEEI